jgi:flagellar protein FliS
MKNPQEAYLRQRILTASPIELIVMLYDGLRKEIKLAERSIGKVKPEDAHKHLIKAQSIVTELLNSLDTSIELSEELFDIYEFLLMHLELANRQKDATELNDLVEIVDNLKDAWMQVAESQKGQMQVAAE